VKLSYRTVERVADSAVRSFAKAHRGVTDDDFADLKQQAIVAVYDLRLDTWDPTRGPFAPWAFQACRRMLARYAIRRDRPASSSDRHLKGLRSVLTLPLDVLEDLPDETPLPDALLEEKELTATVRATVRRWPLGAKVLLEEGKPREVAEDEGCAPTKVYRATDQARRCVTKSDHLRDFWGAL